MPEDDLLDRFDAVLPRLKLYQISQVPAAGSKELVKYREDRYELRMDVFVRGIVAVILGLVAVVGYPTFMAWLTLACALAAVGVGVTSTNRYMRLAFGRRPEEALPPGTDIHTAQLEDGVIELIRAWNTDAFAWNRRVDDLREGFVCWQFERELPETRGLEWSETGSETAGRALIADVQGLSAERSALAARQYAIDRRLRRLDARLLSLKAAEHRPVPALPSPEPEENHDD